MYVLREYFASATFIMSGGSLARSPPGATLNLLNWLVQLPVIAPLIQAVYWAVFCVLAPLLAPLVMLNGLREAVSDALAQEPIQILELAWRSL